VTPLLDELAQAEREVLEHSYGICPDDAFAAGTRRGASICVAQKKPEAPILKNGLDLAVKGTTIHTSSLGVTPARH